MIKQASKLWIFLLATILYVNSVSASHISDAEIRWRNVGKNKYIFSLVLIRDCQGADLFTGEDLILTSCTGQRISLWCDAPSKGGLPVAIEIAQLCPGQISACNGGNQPGFEMVSYYSDTITIVPTMVIEQFNQKLYPGQKPDTLKLTSSCDSWTVAWYSGINDRNNIVNVGSGAKIYVEAKFNTKLMPTSNSPVFTSRPIPYVCVNQPISYNYGVIATDSAVDLRYSLVGARGFDVNTWPYVITNLAYSSGYSETLPIHTIKIDSITGQLTFTPDVIGNFVVVVQVREYDSKGNLVITVMRDMEFVVKACSNKPPDPPTAGSIRNLKNISGTTIQKDSTNIEMCAGSSFSFNLVFTDPNAGDTLSLITNIQEALPGATLTTTGVNPLTATITWTAKEAWINHFLTITAHDDACPIFGEQVFSYNINVLDRTLADYDQTICGSDSAHLTASGGSIFTWSVLSGEAISVPSNFTCNPCANPIARPSKTTSYIVTSNLSGTCVNKDTVTVTVITTTVPKITRITKPFCSTDAIYTLSSTPSGGIWSGKGITDSVNGKFNPASVGAASSLITYSLGGCGGKDTMTIFIKTPPSVKITDVGPFCNTDAAITLSANVNGGTWNGNGITNVNTGAFNPASAKIGTDTISYTITDAITLFGSCGGYDTTVIKVDTFPDVKAAGPFCSTDTTIKQLVATPSGGTWSGKGIVSASSGTYQPSKAGAGTDMIIYTISGKCNKDTIFITINPIPKVTLTTAGPFCDNNAPVSLTATPSGGTWSGKGITSSSGGTFSPAIAGEGNNKVMYKITANNCSDSSSINITVIKTPPAPAITPPPSVCKGEVQGALTASGTGGTIKWYSDAALQPKDSVGTGNSYTPSVTSNASFWATETVGGLCTGPAGTGDITFNPIPSVSFTADPVRGISPLNVSFTNTSESGVTTFQWAFGDAGKSAEENPKHLFIKSGTYIVLLVGIDGNNCMNKDSAIIIVKDSSALFIPNVFTPNGDGKNDMFNIKYTGIKKVQGKIYNRWGEKMYEWTHENINNDITFEDNNTGLDWNGKKMNTGALAPDGVYYYIVDAEGNDGSPYHEKGTVTLIRTGK